MAQIERIQVYPLKGLDGVDLERAKILAGGTFEHDREFALFDDDGAVINGKRTAKVHTLRTDFDPNSKTLTVSGDKESATDSEQHSFVLSDVTERNAAANWFSSFFGEDLTLRRDQSLGYVDRREMGPSVISTATLETIASWFEEMTVDSARRRLRANVEVSGVPPFWEDQFVGSDSPAFEVDGVRFEGVTPCGRCVVPERDPDTGQAIERFREQFVEKRRESFPEWADRGAFDHFYTAMLIARVPESERGKEIEVGAPVRVLENE